MNSLYALFGVRLTDKELVEIDMLKKARNKLHELEDFDIEPVDLEEIEEERC